MKAVVHLGSLILLPTFLLLLPAIILVSISIYFDITDPPPYTEYEEAIFYIPEVELNVKFYFEDNSKDMKIIFSDNGVFENGSKLNSIILKEESMHDAFAFTHNEVCVYVDVTSKEMSVSRINESNTYGSNIKVCNLDSLKHPYVAIVFGNIENGGGYMYYETSCGNRVYP